MNVRPYLVTAVSLAFGPPGTSLAMAAHTGTTDVPGIEPSDIALFVMAVLGVWLARRSMRMRARARRSSED
jgi:ABC-type Na+ efflux pump permease subunit